MITPKLDGWFTAPFSVKSSLLKGPTKGESYKIYYQVLPSTERVDPLRIEAILLKWVHARECMTDILESEIPTSLKSSIER